MRGALCGLCVCGADRSEKVTMFSDFTSSVVGFKSCWETERLSDTQGVQTDPIQQKSADIQTVSKNDAEVQTDLVKPTTAVNVDYDRLAEWLSGIAPRVLEELDKAQRSHAFDDYEPGSTDYKRTLKLLYALAPPQPEFEAKVSAISWSCTGAVVAVGLIAEKHPDWCNHASSLSLYNINRQDFSPNEPTESLRVTSCVTSLAAHPTEAFILVCGTFNGEVILWNLQQKEPTVVGSHSIHREAVTCAEWVRGADSKISSPLLVTAALDGFVILWAVGTRTGSFKPHKCFLLQSDSVSSDYGVVSLSFNSNDLTRFVVAAEGGKILYCTTIGGRPVASIHAVKLPAEVKDTVNPIVTAFESHKGEVNCVEWLPDRKDMFMSCGTDRELRLYDVSTSKPIQVTYLDEPALGVALASSPLVGHPRLLTAWGPSGMVQVYDANTGKRLADLDVGDAADAAPVTTVAFNTKSTQILAVGNIRGRVKVWEAPFYKVAYSSKSVEA